MEKNEQPQTPPGSDANQIDVLINKLQASLADVTRQLEDLKLELRTTRPEPKLEWLSFTREDGSKYEGCGVNGIPNGKGTTLGGVGGVCSWVNGVWRYRSKEWSHVGLYKDGKFDGPGKEFWDHGNDQVTLLFTGEYLNGERDGRRGVEYNRCGSLHFEGRYKDGWREGPGAEYTGSALRCEGEFKGGRRHGHFKQYAWEDMLTFEGEFQDGIEHGPAREYHPYGSLKWEGAYLNGEKHGPFKEYSKSGELLRTGSYTCGVLDMQ